MKYTCRTLLLTCAVAAGWTAIQAERGRRRGDAVKIILESGAQVEYVDSVSGRPSSIESHRFSGRRGLALLMGYDTLRIRAIHFHGSTVGDRQLKAVAEFPEIELLTLTDTNGTDSGLSVLARARCLSAVHLIKNRRITSRGLSQLSGHRSIRAISLTGAKHCGEVAPYLAECPRLESLNLSACDLTDESMCDLARLFQLRDLNVSFTMISDAALVELIKLERLSSLEVAYTRITDSGIEKLSGLHNLSFLNVEATSVTARGVSSLKDKMLGLEVSR